MACILVLIYVSGKLSKIFQVIKKLWPAQEFGLEIHLGVVTRKQAVSVVLLALDTPTWPDIYPYQILSNYLTVWELWPAQDLQRHQSEAGPGGSVGCAVRLETRRSRVQPPPRSATFFHGDWSWNVFYGHSLPSADSRRAVVSFWRKNVHNTG